MNDILLKGLKKGGSNTTTGKEWRKKKNKDKKNNKRKRKFKERSERVMIDLSETLAGMRKLSRSKKIRRKTARKAGRKTDNYSSKIIG